MSENKQNFTLIIGNIPFHLDINKICLFSKRIQNLNKFNPKYFSDFTIKMDIDENSANILDEILTNYDKDIENQKMIEDLLENHKGSEEILFKIGLFLQNHELLLISNKRAQFRNNDEAINFIKERKDLDFRYFQSAIDYLAENRVSKMILNEYFTSDLLEEDEEDNNESDSSDQSDNNQSSIEEDEDEKKANEEINKLISEIYPIRKDLLLLICMSDKLNVENINLLSFAIKIDEKNLYPDHSFLHYLIQKTTLFGKQMEKYKKYSAIATELSEIQSENVNQNLTLKLQSQPSKNSVLKYVANLMPESFLPPSFEKILHENNAIVLIESYTVIFRSDLYPKSWEFQIQKKEEHDRYQVIHTVSNSNSIHPTEINELFIKFDITLDNPVVASYVRLYGKLKKNEEIGLKEFSVNGKKLKY